MNATAETSNSSNDSSLPHKKRKRPLDDAPDNNALVKFKGVVHQKNGNWGAQIYTEQRRYWLGTFKTVADAAFAYDSASIKLRDFDANSPRNFPWNDLTVHEPAFQAGHTRDEVLNMIKDGSYQHKLREHIRARSHQKVPSDNNIARSKQSQGDKKSDKCFACKELFRKDLTPSDVGKLNRLVIHKKHAVTYLPFINDYQKEREEGEKGGDVDDVEVVFYDRDLRQWKFRYCYWRSSQSFVFTRGWNGFVKEKNLKEKDVVVFSTCEFPSNVETLEGQSKSFLMIDVRCFSENGFVAHEEIYVEHQRIWLGTFKSAADAAKAYDSTSIKVRGFDPNGHRNFPWDDFTVHEPAFQATKTRDEVLNMIKDGSYQHKFIEHLRNQSHKGASNNNVVGSKQREEGKESEKCFACKELFEKKLTPSDVGKLNRLVIPKKSAVKYLPFINDYQKEREDGEKGGDVDDVEVVFYDRALKQWKFRYCYWRSSQSFVFTRGWNGFVKEKNLKENDVVRFYTCEVPSNVEISEGQSKKFLMIDVHCFSENGFVAHEEVNKTVHNHNSFEKTENLFNSKLKVEETKSEEKKGGFMLFGVRIQ
ncbi:hypothetical protein AALP_AA4G053000 [Arabis alpina]|uniref:Uncharacterized protein n=1 Tax=Arabis alpina TaxID=50452 RepID=A0A087H1B3_ARAAL|nr:hypothetical protein AALP_AA4G053000 [Arabis alpina]